MRIEHAQVSMIGHREDNQDRCAVAANVHSALIMAIDGMGGHAGGALAAETARTSLLASFASQQQPLFDPIGFLHLALGRAHDDVAALGKGIPLEHRPRATCALALVQDGAAYWAHIGDSRIYHVRDGSVRTRTRDHSHVEILLREGLITEAEVQYHPMRNFVECCLGGDATIPEMSISQRQRLEPGDVLMVCSDGLWANLRDSDIAATWRNGGPAFQVALEELALQAVAASSPYSDNVTAAALRWLG
ncbi:MAG: serine/threonine-protein phosphatase [Steroidobacteraceae bacterium]|nr:serine/threonine-protein phosphatase [Steroidobacteraceae bacterium]MCC7198361.1 serine/threonine-protein phosphatase [Gammaproteobacteria bacterium]